MHSQEVVQPEILDQDTFMPLLETARQFQQSAVMTFFANGKWNLCDVVITAIAKGAFHVKIILSRQSRPINIQINQPVGISLQQEYYRIIFETTVAGVESTLSQGKGGRIVLELPDRAEKMQRRAYMRVPVPKSMKVNAIFWHRGYTDDTVEVPADNYWQGSLLDLSAGGAKVTVELSQSPNFRAGQLVGLQFTPNPYQKPILLEGHIRRIIERAEDNKLCIGVEFLGLEASGAGREKLRRLIEALEDYQRLNTEEGEPGDPD